MVLKKTMPILFDIFTFPAWGRGVKSVWWRNFLYFRYTALISFFWVIFEPVLYLVAIGYGLGVLVKEVNGMPYVQFYSPALMAVSGMFVAYFEGTYGSFTKLARQNTYSTILLTPISAGEIVLGEISWAATKGFLSVLGVTLVMAILGLVNTWLVVPALVVMALVCWLFAAFGVLMAAYAKTYDSFIYSQSAVIVPMALFSGTYFPLSELPETMQKIAYLLPLTHGVAAGRALVNGVPEPSVALNTAILFCLCVLVTNWAVAKMQRRIVS